MHAVSAWAPKRKIWSQKETQRSWYGIILDIEKDDADQKQVLSRECLGVDETTHRNITSLFALVLCDADLNDQSRIRLSSDFECLV